MTSSFEKLDALLDEARKSFPKLDFTMLELEANVELLVESISEAIADKDTSAKHFDFAELTLKVFGQLNDCLGQQLAHQRLQKIRDELNNAVHRLEVAMMEYKTRKDTKKSLAKSGIEAKLKIDPKQAAKAQIYEKFKQWKANQTTYRSGAAFAVSMVSLYPDLRTKSIETWVTKWGKEHSKKTNAQ